MKTFHHLSTDPSVLQPVLILIRILEELMKKELGILI